MTTSRPADAIQFKIGDQIDVSGLWNDGDVAQGACSPEKTGIVTAVDPHWGIRYKVDGYPYERHSSHFDDDLGHSLSWRSCKMYGFSVVGYDYNPSQEGDRDDDL